MKWKYSTALAILVIGWMVVYRSKSSEEAHSPLAKVTIVETLAAAPDPKEKTNAIQSTDRKKKIEPLSKERKAFRQLVGEILSSLPTIEETEAKKDVNPHGPPNALLPAVGRLSEVRASLKQTPASATDAADFYDSCARKEGILLSLRVLCLRNLIDLSADLPESSRPNFEKYPPGIRDVAKSLPGMPFHLSSVGAR